MPTIPIEIHSKAGSPFPDGPPFLPRLLTGKIFRMNAAGFMVANARRYGDLVHYRAASRHVFQFNHPELIQELLIRDVARHHRGPVMQRATFALGHGLLTSEEPLHMRQRRLAQPAFHRDRIAGYGRIIAQYAAEMTGRWPSGQVLDLHGEMLPLALRIVGKCLFDADMEGDVKKISAAVDALMNFLPLVFLPFSRHIQKMPIPAMNRIRKSRVEMDALIYRMIGERRSQPGDRGDLLSMLLESVDTETGDTEENSARMSDEQVRDECLTVLLAGHETTANGLSFALWLLAQHPEIQDRLHTETLAVLGDRTPSAADYPRLNYAAMVFAEAMRLYPPVWGTARTAAETYEYRGFRIPQGSILLAPQIAVHRDPRFYPEPMKFNPDRFTDQAKATRPRLAYFPFGAGSRQCIGEGLAWMEGALVLATIARHWRLRPAPGSPGKIEVRPLVTLRPKNGVHLVVEKRA